MAQQHAGERQGPREPEGVGMSGILIRFALKWAGARLQEKSTYAGLFVLLAGHFGLYFSPELQGAVTQTLIDGVGAALLAMSGKDAVRHYAAATGEPVPNLPAVPTPAEL